MAHRFAGMLVTLGFFSSELHTSPTTPRARRVRDACLEAFADLGPRSELATELELARRVGKVARSLVWLRAVRAEGFGSAGARRLAPLSSLAAVLAESRFDLG